MAATARSRRRIDLMRLLLIACSLSRAWIAGPVGLASRPYSGWLARCGHEAVRWDGRDYHIATWTETAPRARPPVAGCGETKTRARARPWNARRLPTCNSGGSVAQV